MQDVLVKYRIHEEQITHKGGKEGTSYWNDVRNKYIDTIINS
jgi:hypothetical protein